MRTVSAAHATWSCSRPSVTDIISRGPHHPLPPSVLRVPLAFTVYHVYHTQPFRHAYHTTVKRKRSKPCQLTNCIPHALRLPGRVLPRGPSIATRTLAAHAPSVPFADAAGATRVHHQGPVDPSPFLPYCYSAHAPHRTSPYSCTRPRTRPRIARHGSLGGVTTRPTPRKNVCVHPTLPPHPSPTIEAATGVPTRSAAQTAQSGELLAPCR